MAASDQEGQPDDGPEASPTGPPAPGSTPRVRRAHAAAIAVVVGLVGVLVVGSASLWLRNRGSDARTRSGPEVVDEFVAAYTRSVDGTFRVEGELTRTMDDGRELRSAYLVVQRRPDHLQRSFGSTVGDVGGRTVNCTSDVEGEPSCATGAPAEPWDAQRAEVLGALDQYVRGVDPLYSVTTEGDGCFDLARRRTVTDASFGRRARLCFDERTGAIRRLEVHREGGATDVMLATVITDEVTAADFDLGADATYDPQVPDGSGTAPPSTS